MKEIGWELEGGEMPGKVSQLSELDGGFATIIGDVDWVRDPNGAKHYISARRMWLGKCPRCNEGDHLPVIDFQDGGCVAACKWCGQYLWDLTDRVFTRK